MAEVIVKRTLLSAGTIDDPNRKLWAIEYRAGELPPHIIYISEKDYTKEKEVAAIKADIKKRLETVSEKVTI